MKLMEINVFHFRCLCDGSLLYLLTLPLHLLLQALTGRPLTKTVGSLLPQALPSSPLPQAENLGSEIDEKLPGSRKGKGLKDMENGHQKEGMLDSPKERNAGLPVTMKGKFKPHVIMMEKAVAISGTDGAACTINCMHRKKLPKCKLSCSSDIFYKQVNNAQKLRSEY